MAAAETIRPRAGSRLRGPALGVAFTVGVTLVLWVWLGRPQVDYDIGWALIWGRELAHGHGPSYQLLGAPTPHPLDALVAAVASPLGSSAAYTVMALIAYAGFGALVWLTFRLGQSAFSWPVGVAAAFVVATSYDVVAQTASGFFDVPVAAAVIGAAVLEVRRPRRGGAVLILLAVAGLQRPEVWLLTAAYWLYLAPPLSWPERLKLAALAAAGPLLWALTDLIATGNPLFSFGPTRHNALTLHAGRPLPTLLREVLRLPVLAGALVGLGLALWLQRARAALPAGLAILSTVAVALLSASGLALLQRWTFIPAAALAVMFGFAAFGWTLEQRGRRRTAWAIAGALLLVAVIVSGRPHFKGIQTLPDQRDGPSRAGDDLRLLAQQGRSAALMRRCPRIAVPTGFVRPFVAYYADRDVVSVAGSRRKRATALVLEPADADARELQHIGVFARPVPARPPGFRPVAGNRSWRLYAGPASCRG